MKRKHFSWHYFIILLAFLCLSIPSRAENVSNYIPAILKEGPSICKDLYLNQDGSIYFFQVEYTNNGKSSVLQLHHLKNQEDKIILEVPQNIHGSHSMMCCFDLDEHGNVYILYWLMDEDKLTMDVYDSTGALTYNSVNFDTNNSRALTLRMYHDTAFILNGNFELDVFTNDGKIIISPFRDRLVHNFTLDSNGILYAITSINGSAGSCKLLIADTNDNYAILDEVRISDDFLHAHICYEESSKKCYLGNSKEIYSYDPIEKTTLLINFEQAGLYFTELPQMKIPELLNFEVDSERNIYVLSEIYQEDEENGSGYRGTLTKLAISDSVQKNEDKQKTTLTITAAYKQDFLAEAVRQYEYVNPSVEIVWDLLYPNYKTFKENVEDAGKRMAIKIMTNDVGDIVATGGMGLVYYDALQTDAFVDLTEYLQKDAIGNQLNQTVFKSMTLDDKITGLPVGMSYSSLVYNRELGDSYGLALPSPLKWSDILRIGIEHPEISLFGADDPSDTLQILIPLLNAQLPDLIDLKKKQVNLQQEWFLELLADLKTVYQAGNLTKQYEANIFSKAYRAHLFEMNPINGHYDHLKIYYQNGEGAIAYLPLPEGEIHRNAIAYPFRMYSISSNSQNKDIAWNFLSSLLNPDIQNMYTLDAVPVNNDSEEYQRTKNVYSDELNDQVKTIIDTVDFGYDYSNYKTDLIVPILKYLQDEYSLDDAIAEAEYNVWLRLNE